MPDTVTHRGFCVWLRDDKGKHLNLGRPQFVNAARDEVVSTVELQKKTLYAIDWCKVEGAPRINARCDIFRPDKEGKPFRIGNHSMSAEEPESQKRTSFGRLEEPLRKDSWLSSHHGAGASDVFVQPLSARRLLPGCVSLAIRRLRSPPEETISPLTSKTDNYEMILDYLDSDDPEMIDEVTGQPMRPYVSFVFKFKMLKEHGAVPLSITNSEADTIVIETPGRNSTQEIDSPTPPSLSGSIPSPRKRPPRDHLYDSEVETLLERRKRTKTRMDQVQQENLQRREEIRQLLEGLRQTVKSEETALVRAEQESQDLKSQLQKLQTSIQGY